MYKIKINDKTPSQRVKTDNGYLIVKDNPIVKAGVFDYLVSELFSYETMQELGVNLNGNDVVKVCRPFSDLSRKKDKFKGMPIMQEHFWVGKARDERKSVDGAIMQNITEAEPYLKADLIIYNSDLIDKIEKGELVELSPAYDCKIIKEKGLYNGESYDFKQDLQGVNHLAVVENGRSGKDLKIMDSNIKGVKKMEFGLKDLTNAVIKALKVKDEAVKEEDSIENVAEKILELTNSELDNDTKKAKLIEFLQVIKGKEEPKLQDEDSEAKDEDSEKENEIKDEDSEKENEVKDEDCEKEKLQDSLDRFIKERVGVIISQLQDSQNAYFEVKSALGCDFKNEGMAVADMYRYGYETLTGAKLADGMDAKTAFKMLGSQKTLSIKANDNAIDSSWLEKFDIK